MKYGDGQRTAGLLWFTVPHYKANIFFFYFQPLRLSQKCCINSLCYCTACTVFSVVAKVLCFHLIQISVVTFKMSRMQIVQESRGYESTIKVQCCHLVCEECNTMGYDEFQVLNYLKLCSLSYLYICAWLRFQSLEMLFV